jgi:hypothetical protein
VVEPEVKVEEQASLGHDELAQMLWIEVKGCVEGIGLLLESRWGFGDGISNELVHARDEFIRPGLQKDVAGR